MTDWPVPGQQRGTWGTQLVDKIEEELGERDDAHAGLASTVATHTTQIAYTNPGSAGDHRTVLSWQEDGTPAKAGIPVSPLLFGAVGDGTTDDSAALASYILAMKNNPAGLSTGNGFILDGHNRTYKITETWEIIDIWNLQMRNFNILVDGTLTDAILCVGVSFSTFEHIRISGKAGWDGGDTVDYAWRFETGQDGASPAEAVCSHNTLVDVQVLDLKAKNGLAFGPTSAGYQVDNFKLYGCWVLGNNDGASPDTTWYQSAYLFGSGTAANILLFYGFGCSATGYRYSVDVNNTDVYWFGGMLQNAEANIRHEQSIYPLLVQGVRSESSQRFFLSRSGGEVACSITLDTILFACNDLAANTYWIDFSNVGMLNLRNIRVQQAGGSGIPHIRMSNSNAKHLTIHGMTAPTPIQTCHTLAGTTGGWITGYTETDPSTQAVVSTNLGTVLIGTAGLHSHIGTSAPDVDFYRNTSIGTGWYTSQAFFAGRRFEVVNTASSSDPAFRTKVSGGAAYRYNVLTSGETQWGDGTAALDISLRRGAADRLELASGDMFRVGNQTSLPTAASGYRGYIARVEGDTGVYDTLYVGQKNADDAYEWTQIGPYAGPQVINASLYGLSTTNTADANATALNAAIAAAPDMGTVFIPRGWYDINNLTALTKTVTLVGEGRCDFTDAAEFGHSSFQDPAKVIGGTVLALAATSGTFLDCSTSHRYGATVNLQHLSLVGQGTSASTLTAVATGSAAVGSSFQDWDDVAIANVAIGHRGKMMFHCSWDGIWFKGCKQAMVWSDNCNANRIGVLLVNQCGWTATNAMDITASNNVRVDEMTLQSNYAGTVLYLGSGAENWDFGPIYSENPNTFGLGIDYAIDLGSGADRHRFSWVLANSANDDIRIGGQGNEMYLSKYISGTVTDTGNRNELIYKTAISPGSTVINSTTTVRTGKFVRTVTAAQSPYSVQVDDGFLILDTSAGDITITMPAGTSSYNRRIAIKKGNASNTATIDGNGTNVEGSASKSFTTNLEVWDLVCSGSAWWRL